MEAILIPTDEKPRAIELESGDSISEIVGGFFQGVYPDVPGSILYLNEEGKILGLNPNQNTDALSKLNLSLSPLDIVVGAGLILGYDDEGESTDVPKELLIRLGLV